MQYQITHWQPEFLKNNKSAMPYLIYHKMKAILFFMILFSCIMPNNLKAQEVVKGQTNSWFSLLNRLELNDKWSVSNELHERTGAFLHNQGQFLVRPSIDYHLNKQVEFSLGYTYIHSNPYNPYSLPIERNENNIWEQVLLKNTIGKVKLLHRFRQEHRWVNHIEETNGNYALNGNDFLTRFRYRFITTFDIHKFQKPEHKLFAVAWDEIWISQSDNLAPKDFNRNWLYLGVGYTFNPTTNVQAGLIEQYDKVGANNFISSPIAQFTLVKNFKN